MGLHLLMYLQILILYVEPMALLKIDSDGKCSHMKCEERENTGGLR